jgi:hypothetical protein
MDVHRIYREYPMMSQKPTLDQLRHRFSYHPPHDDQQRRYELIRELIGDLAIRLVNLTPCSPEQSWMLNSLDEVMFLANASIARNEFFTVPFNQPPPGVVKGPTLSDPDRRPAA